MEVEEGTSTPKNPRWTKTRAWSYGSHFWIQCLVLLTFLCRDYTSFWENKALNTQTTWIQTCQTHQPQAQIFWYKVDLTMTKRDFYYSPTFSSIMEMGAPSGMLSLMHPLKGQIQADVKSSHSNTSFVTNFLVFEKTCNALTLFFPSLECS